MREDFVNELKLEYKFKCTPVYQRKKNNDKLVHYKNIQQGKEEKIKRNENIKPRKVKTSMGDIIAAELRVTSYTHLTYQLTSGKM